MTTEGRSTPSHLRHSTGDARRAFYSKVKTSHYEKKLTSRTREVTDSTDNDVVKS